MAVKKKTATTKAVAKASASKQLRVATAADVPAAIANLESQLKQVQGNAPETEKTSGVWENGMKLKGAKVSDLLMMEAACNQKEAAYKLVAKKYSEILPTPPPFKIAGYSTSAWRNDISKAVHDSINSQTVNKLKAAITKLKTHLSAEAKLQNDLESIMAMGTAPIQ